MGVKGAGEAGAIGSCPAVVNAIVEGLWREYKIDHIDMPATAERVWIAIREHQRRHSLLRPVRPGNKATIAGL